MMYSLYYTLCAVLQRKIKGHFSIPLLLQTFFSLLLLYRKYEKYAETSSANNIYDKIASRNIFLYALHT